MSRRRIRLKVALIEKNLTQREAADAIGIRESRMSDICCGSVDPRPFEATALSELLECPVDWLFDLELAAGGDAS